jgi:uncharacterized protein involved in exopolysaccharide biosynthesis
VRGAWDAAGDELLRSRGIDVAERRILAVRELVLNAATIERVLQGEEFGPRDGASTPGETEQWSRAIRVVPQGATSFRIECVASDAGKAALVANRLAAELVQGSQHAAANELASGGLAAQLAAAQRRVEKSTEALRRARGGDASRARDGRLTEMHEITLKLAAVRARAEQLRGKGEATGAAAGDAEGPPLRELDGARERLAELRQRYTDEHPDVERLVARIRTLEEADARQRQRGKEELQAVDAEIAALTARLAALDRGPSSRSSLRRASGDPTALLSEHAAAVSAYQTLLERARAARAVAQLGRTPIGRFEIVRAASVPEAPESRGLALAGLLGGVIGLMLGITLAVRAELRDVTVRGPEDLAGLGPLVLATIPLVRGGGARSR